VVRRVFVCVQARREVQAWEDLAQSQGGEGVLSAAERSALEFAIRLKEEAGWEVVALSFGGQAAQSALHACLGRGAARAIHLLYAQDLQPDAWVTANALAETLGAEEFQLILCGDASADNLADEMPAFLAEVLDLPQATRVVDFDISESGITIQRLLERGRRQKIACALPCVLAVAASAAGGRYVSVYQRSQAFHGRIETRPCTPARENLITCEEITPPRARVRRIAAPQANLSAAERMKFLMAGGKRNPEAGSSSGVFEGTPDDAAERIFTFLREQGFVSGAPSSPAAYPPAPKAEP